MMSQKRPIFEKKPRTIDDFVKIRPFLKNLNKTHSLVEFLMGF